jgi:hypothetical protein
VSFVDRSPTPVGEAVDPFDPIAVPGFEFVPVPDAADPPGTTAEPAETSGSATTFTGAPGATVVVAKSATELALRFPTDFGAPDPRIPTFAAMAPVAAVTRMAVAPAKVSARCLFMNRNLRAP